MTRGFTLVELVAVLAVLGVVLGVAGLTWPASADDEPGRVVRELQAARREAALSGVAVTWRRDRTTVRFLPDGSATAARFPVGAAHIVVDPLSGSVRAQR